MLVVLQRKFVILIFVINSKLKKIVENGDKNIFWPFVNLCNNNITDPVEKVITFDSMSSNLFKLTNKMLLWNFI